MKILLKLLKNQVGAGVATSLVAFAALGGSVYYMLENSVERNKLLIDTNQSSIAETRCLTLRKHLRIQINPILKSLNLLLALILLGLMNLNQFALAIS